MHHRSALVIALCASLFVPAAHANSYRVRPGDTLSAIALRAGTSVGTLAALNHISPAAPLLAGAVLELPVGADATARYRVQAGDNLSVIAQRFHTTVPVLANLNHLNTAAPLLIGTVLRVPTAGVSEPTAAPASYVVKPGDSLSGIALRTGTSMGAIASLNHLDPSGVLVIGTKLLLPPNATGDVAQTFSRSSVRASIAFWSAHYDVDEDLAAALAWMESGFNNAVVSVDGARGVMQVTPQTWAYVEQVLLLGQSVPDTPDGNVRVGIAYLHHLLHLYDGNERDALAAYYEGARALARDGELSGTDQYVNDVLALASRF